MPVSRESSLVLRPNRSQIFWEKYQYVVSIFAAFMFFADLPEYIDRAGLFPTNALHFMILCGLLALPLWRKIADLPKYLTIWLIGYTLLTLIALMAFPVDEVVMREFRMRMLTVIFIPIMFVLFHQKSLKHIQVVFAIVGIISVINCFIQLVDPVAFGLPVEESPRPAGFYINPTKTGAALVLAMIFGIGAVKQTWRIPYCLFIFAGILATFSRSAMIPWAICFAIYLFTKVLMKDPRKLIAPLLVLGILFSIINPLQLILEPLADAGLVSYSIKERLEWTQDSNTADRDESAAERKDVAKLGWQYFGNSPYLGNGLGSTNKWNARVSTHNMFLYMMADHGVIGLILLPTLVWAPLYKNRAVPMPMLLCYVSFMLIISCFSHNVMEERYILIMTSFLAAMKVCQEQYVYYDPSLYIGVTRKLLPPSKY
jgi:hypothetical protein